MATDILGHVDSFFGVDAGGNCLCGPHLPFGLARPGPDIVPPQPTNGFRTLKPILHFSQTHVSGTGGSGRFGNIGLLPLAGGALAEPAGYDLHGATAQPGYFSGVLGASGIRVEITCTHRVACYRIHFPAGGARMLLRTGAVVCRAKAIGGHLQWIDKNEVVGQSELQGGWGHDLPYQIHFAASFSVPATSILVGVEPELVCGRHATGVGVATLADFGDVPCVEVRIGISHVSIAQARAAVSAESAGHSFQTILEGREDSARIAVANWGILDGKVTTNRTCAVGEHCRLELLLFSDIFALRSEYLELSDRDLNLPLYYQAEQETTGARTDYRQLRPNK